MLQICQNIKQARVSKGWTQEEMAGFMSIERATYKNWEDQTEPSLSNIKALAKVFKIPPHRLLAGVIDFSDTVDDRPDITIEAVLSAEQVDKVRFSLDVLDSIFSPSSGSKKGKRWGIVGGELSGSKKLPQVGKKKKGQKGTSP